MPKSAFVVGNADGSDVWNRLWDEMSAEDAWHAILAAPNLAGPWVQVAESPLEMFRSGYDREAGRLVTRLGVVAEVRYIEEVAGDPLRFETPNDAGYKTRFIAEVNIEGTYVQRDFETHFDAMAAVDTALEGLGFKLV